MRHLPYVVVTSLALLVTACGDDDDSPGGTAGAGGSESSGGDGSGDAPSGAGRGGRGGASSGVEFTDLPGKIRFINLVSDGASGQALDLYWGTSITRSEKAATIAYGEVTEFLTPRRLEDPILAPDEARLFMVLKDDVSSTPASFLVQEDPKFTDSTVLTVALAAADSISDGLVVSRTTFQEHELSTPPAGMAHVYGWDRPFSQITDGKFVLVGADGLCDPDNGEDGGSNIGFPSLMPDGTTGLALFDANTECATGTPPLEDAVEAGHSYVLLGEAETYELDARKAVLLEVGTEN